MKHCDCDDKDLNLTRESHKYMSKNLKDKYHIRNMSDIIIQKLIKTPFIHGISFMVNRSDNSPNK